MLAGSPSCAWCGKMPSSMPATKTTGNSRPLAECTVIIVTALCEPLSESRSERRASHSMSAGSFSAATGGSPGTAGGGGSYGRLVEGARPSQLLEALERLCHVIVRLVELGGHAEELLDVLDAAIGLYRMLRLERLQETGPVDDGLHHVRETARHGAARLHGTRELAERVADLGAEQARLGDARLGCREERQAVGDGIRLDLADRRGADTATRGVDDAQGGHVVVGVDDDLEVGHDVANLLAVEEARATDDLVRHARPQEHVLEHARLRVGAIEDGRVVVARARVVELLDLRTDPAALVALVGGLVHANPLAVAGIGKESLGRAARVVGHDGVGRVEDVPGGAVVLLELDHARVGIVLLEGEDVLDVGAAP